MASSLPTRPPAGAPGTAAPPRPRRAPVARMRRGADLVTVALSAWLIGGLFVDGWAHNTRPRLEAFFTPWHAVLYSGFVASALWTGWAVWSRRRAGTTWRDRVPAGYGLAVAGLVLFAASGLGDMAWHLAFGVEQAIAALLSPTHLGLFAGGMLAAAPARLRGFCAVAPVAMWGAWFGGMALAYGGLGWEPEVWVGAVVWSALALLALAVLATPSPVPAEPPRPADHPAGAS